MSFQKCPICEGKGELFYYTGHSLYKQCKTCKGTGIINDITGLPPTYDSPIDESKGELKTVKKDVDLIK